MKERPEHDPFVLFVHWEETLSQLFTLTMRFPKRLRSSLALRLENLALSMAEELVDLRYSKRSLSELERLNRQLDKLRLLLRFAMKQQAVSFRQYEHLSRRLDEWGRMLGGWKKTEAARELSHH